MLDNLGPLVSTAWLEAALGRPDLVVLDASWYLPQTGRDAREEYLHRHIPGALFYDLDAISDPLSPLPHMLGEADHFASAMGALGISNDSVVVCYDGSGANLSAARAWWTCKVFGHDRAAVLDGGLVAWQREGRPLESGAVQRPAARFTASYRKELVRSIVDVRDALERSSAQVVDARSAGRFTGREPEPRPGLRPGHMPGAHNLPYPELVDAEGRLLPPEQLRERFQSAGVDLSRPVVTSCGSGVSAAALLLALERLGHRQHALYDGSWAEYGSTDLPVEKG
jgi:thiosulfate/3-mercaptopyruvate sulfurtransferase